MCSIMEAIRRCAPDLVGDPYRQPEPPVNISTRRRLLQFPTTGAGVVTTRRNLRRATTSPGPGFNDVDLSTFKDFRSRSAYHASSVRSSSTC